ncbi:hypothetical protein KC331_g42 [Hortaea werneckii]|nr:hypothetical protein KC331_g42 [Hortaea werneckii]
MVAWHSRWRAGVCLPPPSPPPPPSHFPAPLNTLAFARRCRSNQLCAQRREIGFLALHGHHTSLTPLSTAAMSSVTSSATSKGPRIPPGQAHPSSASLTCDSSSDSYILTTSTQASSSLQPSAHSRESLLPAVESHGVARTTASLADHRLRQQDRPQLQKIP